MSTDSPLEVVGDRATPALDLTVLVAGEPDGQIDDDGPLTRLLDVVISLADLQALALSATHGLRLSLDVDLRWLEVSLPAPQDEIHRVMATRPTDDSAATVGVLGGALIGGTVRRSLPTSYDLTRVGVGVTREQADALDDYIYYEDLELQRSLHQVLGYQHPVQGDVWEAVKDDLERVHDVDALQRMATMEHRLLLQLDDDPSCALSIGDRGRLYVLIPAEDLAALRFDRTLACCQTS
jgi:hypothetical protein